MHVDKIQEKLRNFEELILSSGQNCIKIADFVNFGSSL